MNKLTPQISLSLLEQIFSKGINTVVILFAASKLPISDFGIFSTILLVTSFITKFALYGLTTFGLGRSNISDYLLNKILNLSVLSALFLITPTFLCILIIYFERLDVILVGIFLCMSVIFNVMLQVISIKVIRNRNFHLIAYRAVISNLLSSLVVLLMLYNNYGVIVLAIHQVVNYGIMLIITLYKYRFIKFMWIRLKLAQILYGQSNSYALTEFLTLYNKESPKIFAAIFLDNLSMGYISMIMRIYNLAVDLFAVSITRVSVNFFRQYRTEATLLSVVYQKIILSVGIGVTFALSMLCLILPYAIDLLLSDAWSEIVLPSQIILIAATYMVLGYTNGTYFIATDQQNIRWMFTKLRTAFGSILLFFSSTSIMGLVIALLIRAIIIESMQVNYVAMQLQKSKLGYLVVLPIPLVVLITGILVT